MVYCEDCGRRFPSYFALKEHWAKSPHHDYCPVCEEHFHDSYDLDEHNDDVHSDSRCVECSKVFKSNYGLHQHFRQSSVHASKYCTPCGRLFLSESNLKAHLNSSVHRPKDVLCPGAGCGLMFVSRSAMILHLEAGSCRSGMTRNKVNQIVRSVDTGNVITDPSRLITGGSSTTYYATGASWNGDAYECCLCHNTYRSLAALNQHLTSPRHQTKIYLCPLDTCRERFSTLSGLCQHVESERCGVLKFRQVQRVMDGMVSGMRRLTMA